MPSDNETVRGDDETVRGALPYRSSPLASLLDVFARWGTDGFIGALSRRAGIDLDTTSVIAVTMLARYGPMRSSALAANLHVGASNVSKITAHLGSLGLVRKTSDPADARASLVELTDAGTKVMNDLVDQGDAMMDDILDGWSAAEREELDRLLRRFERDAAAYARTLPDRAQNGRE